MISIKLFIVYAVRGQERSLHQNFNARLIIDLLQIL